ncbi:MAG: GNAT family N-acetyltransferase [Candidatus Hodarchaeales archaeon]
MSNKNDEIIIRSLIIPDDGKKLADLFNAFNESWEMGFQGQGQNNAVTALDIATRIKSIITYIAEDPDGRFVGYCSVHPHYYDDDACFVGILGVHPDVLGKKVGKRLMLKAMEKTIEKGQTRLDLGTWAGNLKAMPLYKKLGLMWVPDTAVSMEGYIPLIRSLPLLSDFWKKHPDWYSVFQREITQAPDEDRFNSLKVYTYTFTENEDQLKVWIDKYAKNILGFEMKIEDNFLKMYLDSPSNKIYRGVDFSVTLVIESSEPLDDLKVDTNLPEGLKLIQKNPLSDNSGSLRFNYSILVETSVPLYKQHHKGIIAPFAINWEDNRITLSLGFKVQSAIEIKVNSMNETFNFNHNPSCINLALKNNLNYSIKGILTVSDVNNFICTENEYDISLEKDEEINLPIKIAKIARKGMLSFKSIINYKMTASDDEVKSLRTEEISYEIPVLSLDEQYIVFDSRTEENIRIYNGMSRYDVNLRGGVLTAIPSNFFRQNLTQTLGRPFGFDEFGRLVYDWELIDDEGVRKLKLVAKSLDRPGIILLKEITLYHSNIIKIDFRLKNESDRNYSNLALRANFSAANNPQNSIMVVPADGQIYKYDKISAPRNEADTGTDPSRFHESWVVSEESDHNTVAGIFWEQNRSLEEIKIRDYSNSLDFNAEINANEERRIATVWLYSGPGNWRTVRDYWYSLVAKVPQKRYEWIQSKGIFNAEVINCSFKSNKCYSIEIELKTPLLMPIKGTITINTNSGQFSPSTIDFCSVKSKPAILTTEFRSENVIPGNEIDFTMNIATNQAAQTLTSSFSIPVESLAKNIISKDSIDDQVIYRWDHPSFKGFSAPGFIPGFASLECQNGSKITRTCYPQAIPNLFLAKDPGGIFFSIAKSFEYVVTGKSLISFTAREITENSWNSWEGLIFTLNNDNLPEFIPDIYTEFTILANPCSNDILFRFRFENRSKTFQKAEAFLGFSPELRNDLKSAFMKGSEKFTTHPVKEPRQLVIIPDIGTPVDFWTNDWKITIIHPEDYVLPDIYANFQPVFVFIGSIIPVELQQGEVIETQITYRITRQ